MFAHLFENGVEEGEGPVRVSSDGMFGGIDPQGKELGREISAPCRLEVDHAHRRVKR